MSMGSIIVSILYNQFLANEVETLQKKLDLYISRLDEVEKQSASYKEKYLTLAGEIRIKEKAAEDIARIALKEANVCMSSNISSRW